jgi:DNA-binding PadR family transcriptional regulator
VVSRAYRRLVRKLTVEVLWLYVARVLADSGPLRAYDIRKAIESRFGFRPRAMTVYTVVYRMAAEGLLQPVKVGDTTLYSLTEFGRREFEAALEYLRRVVESLSSGSGGRVP